MVMEQAGGRHPSELLARKLSRMRVSESLQVNGVDLFEMLETKRTPLPLAKALPAPQLYVVLSRVVPFSPLS